jgi:hypothetical protein
MKICSGQPVTRLGGRGRCPHAPGRREGDSLCPCERIRACKLLVLTVRRQRRGIARLLIPAEGASIVGARIQYAVCALCVVEFLCSIPEVKDTVKRLGRWLMRCGGREAAVGAASGAAAGLMAGGPGATAGAAAGAVAGLVTKVAQDALAP